MEQRKQRTLGNIYIKQFYYILISIESKYISNTIYNNWGDVILKLAKHRWSKKIASCGGRVGVVIPFLEITKFRLISVFWDYWLLMNASFWWQWRGRRVKNWIFKKTTWFLLHGLLIYTFLLCIGCVHSLNTWN